MRPSCPRCVMRSISAQIPGCTEEQQDAAYRFIAGGCGNLIAGWLGSGRTASPKELAQRIGGLCQAFLAAYREICQASPGTVT